jgi:hypothetical protein
MLASRLAAACGGRLLRCCALTSSSSSSSSLSSPRRPLSTRASARGLLDPIRKGRGWRPQGGQGDKRHLASGPHPSAGRPAQRHSFRDLRASSRRSCCCCCCCRSCYSRPGRPHTRGRRGEGGKVLTPHRPPSAHRRTRLANHASHASQTTPRDDQYGPLSLCSSAPPLPLAPS